MDIKKIIIAGSGTMGSSMGASFAKYGFETTIYDISSDAIEKAKSLIKLNLETEISEKIISKKEAEILLNRLNFSMEKEVFNNADLVVEAIIENIDIKKDFWAEISKIVPKQTILTTNTSGLSITRIQEAVIEPERFAGFHWINPPHIIPLIEIIKGEKTNDETIEKIYKLSESIDKKPVIVNDAPGFVLNRLQFAILREALHIVENGISTVEGVDDVMKYGLGGRYAALGPFQVADLGGLDIFYNISSYLFNDLGDEKEPFSILKESYEKGEYGVKSKKGFYDYSNGKDEEIIRYRDEILTKISKIQKEK
ncbi:MAG: 3-hydroxyacyl-CoA dehydrogenase family protein [Tissierellia bacterium]|nr:3-hydroxyacyl-CoA dehydrogenase family protein [Tissierellia bacterium]